ncbi:type IV pilus biogenesis protein PilM [Aneurinibacillus terranovensis]|uniref:type IV pilus biogenesis protein PilM n=1 Tax=Aneurinibacillus terranovensis TaxID=278991 RepID=UPI000407F57C|nr:pilus assembly protein PilM [Aneurinibacillus terranovensis]
MKINTWKPKLSHPFSIRKSPGRVGMELEDEGLRYAEVRYSSGGLKIKQAGMIPLDSGLIENGKIIDEDQVLVQLALGLKEAKLKHKKAVISAPTSSVVMRKVSLPKLPPKEVRSFIEIELESTIHLPFSRPYFDFYKMGQDENTNKDTEASEAELQDQYLVIAAPGDLIDQYVRLFSELDIQLAAVDIEPLALYRLLDMLQLHTGEQYHMFIHLGMHTVDVSFFNREIPEFMRNIPLDLTNYKITMDERNLQSSDLLQFLEDRGMFDSFANDLVRELDRVINFYHFSMKNDGTRMQKIYVTGDFPDIDRMIPFLKERLSVQEIISLPVHSYVDGFSATANVQAYTVPFGLSLKG